MMSGNGRCQARVVTALVAVLVAGGCTEPARRPERALTHPATPVPTASVDRFAELRRPWAQPMLPTGGNCPVTTAVGRPDPGLGPMLGDGPARPVGLGTGAVLDYLSPTERTDWSDRTWGGQKVLWAVDPAVVGPVLVRGRQLDGPDRLAFEDPALPELVLNIDAYEGQPGGWKDYPSYTRIRTPGCYAYQVDIAQGSSTVVFIARGPRV